MDGFQSNDASRQVPNVEITYRADPFESFMQSKHVEISDSSVVNSAGANSAISTGANSPISRENSASSAISDTEWRDWCVCRPDARFQQLGNSFVNVHIESEEDKAMFKISRKRSNSFSGVATHAQRAKQVSVSRREFIEDLMATSVRSRSCAPGIEMEHDIFTRLVSTAPSSIEKGADMDESVGPSDDSTDESYGDGPSSGGGELYFTPPGDTIDRRYGTTVMIRNLPKRIKQSALAKQLDVTGFRNTYDFVYMPCVIAAKQGKGYAFVNFVTPEAAQVFMQASHYFTCSIRRRTNLLNVSLSSIQGKEANIAQWMRGKTNRITNPAFRPIVIDCVDQRRVCSFNK